MAVEVQHFHARRLALRQIQFLGDLVADPGDVAAGIQQEELGNAVDGDRDQRPAGIGFHQIDGVQLFQCAAVFGTGSPAETRNQNRERSENPLSAHPSPSALF
ncbi:MAG TPA: hypothetical protein VHX18_04160 [Rhizomicrobium sp.]|jgi:hypothetical protein|nr:hypothetical protein [Rhizomicrobium sp.]